LALVSVCPEREGAPFVAALLVVEDPLLAVGEPEAVSVTVTTMVAEEFRNCLSDAVSVTVAVPFPTPRIKTAPPE
jgi:hypothetical protein